MLRVFSFLFFFLSTLFFAVSAFTDSLGPQETVESVLSSINREQSIVAILPFVHWENVFNKAKDTKSLPKGISTPLELRSFYKELFTDPVGFGLKQYVSPPEHLDDSAKSAYQKHLQTTVRDMKRYIDNANKKLLSVKYRVVDVRIDGKTAHVDIMARLKGREVKRTWKLVKVKDRWLFPDFNVVG